MGRSVERANNETMAQFRWLTGVLALLLMAARLTRLLQPVTAGPSWMVILLSLSVLGGVITWIASTYRLSWRTVFTLNLVGVLLASLRIIAPATLRFGIVPTSETLTVLGTEIGFAAEVFRFGSAPVIAIPGLVAAIGIACWAFGALIAVAAMTDRPWIGSLPPVVFYLQLATLDRQASTKWWIGAFAAVATLAFIAAGPVADRRTGRLKDRDGLMIPRRVGVLPTILGVVMVATAVLGTTALNAAVPEAGSVDWRTRSGIGSGLYGQGASFNLFVGLQQNLVSLSDEPVFSARVSQSAPDNDELYWRLITLDVFDGANWIPGSQGFARNGDTRYEQEEWRFTGPTTDVSARVRIDSLAQQLLPVLYSTTNLTSENELISESFRVREDGSIGIDLRTRPGWEFEIRASVPDPDIAQLASVGGRLSPIFEEATSQGAFELRPRPALVTERPEEIETYLELPDDVSPAVKQAAITITEPGTTRFEDALILEAFFRDPDNFIYSTEVTTGHSSLDLEAWLLDPESQNFRTGYCEQFATAMAVMARAINLPSRVVLGFTPGDIDTQSDGSEIIVVRERNAHAWVEIWLDGQGWVRFDPTPRGDGVNRSLGDIAIGFDARAYVPAPQDPEALAAIGGALPGERNPLLPDFDEFGGDATPDLRGRVNQGIVARWVMWVGGVLLALGLLPIFKMMRRRRRLAEVATGNIETAWMEITDRLRDLGTNLSDDLTPLEIASAKHSDLVPLARMYSARAYGGTPVGDGRRAFETADTRISLDLNRPDRLKEKVSLASLRRR